MKYKQATGKSIQDAFDAFHRSNPNIYEIIEEQAMKAVQLGKKKISIKMIVNWIRWNIYIETVDTTYTYKINDAYTSRYARLFIDKNPSLSHIIETRDLRA